jgi:seryl-tRNA synthetase
MTTSSLDQQFASLVIELHQHYQTVNDAMRKIESGSLAAPSVELLSQVNSLLDPVKATEAKLRPIREQMETAGRSTPAELKPVIDQTVEIVSFLLPKIGELENSAKESRAKLAPKIGESVRAMRMQSAYGRKR